MTYTDAERASDQKINAVEFLPITGLQLPVAVQESNFRRFNSDKHVTTCFLCNRPLTAQARDNGWQIHLHVQLGLIPNSADIRDDQGSQGCFPVGSECAKRVPLAYRFRFTN